MFKQRDSMVVEGKELSSLFLKASPLQYLRPFFDKPQTLSQASKSLNIEISSYYYWIKKFLRLGLLVVAYEKKRAGSSIKYYSTPAKHFILKLGQDYQLLKEYFQAANLAYCDDSIRSAVASVASTRQDLALVFSIDKQNEIKSKISVILDNEKIVSISSQMLKPDMPAVFTTWYEMQLRFQDAKEFQARLYELMREYQEKVEPGQSDYLIQLSIVPTSPHLA